MFLDHIESGILLWTMNHWLWKMVRTRTCPCCSWEKVRKEMQQKMVAWLRTQGTLDEEQPFYNKETISNKENNIQGNSVQK